MWVSLAGAVSAASVQSPLPYWLAPVQGLAAHAQRSSCFSFVPNSVRLDVLLANVRLKAGF